MGKNEKNRVSEGNSWIYGKHAVKAALQNPQRKILRLVILESCEDFLGENAGSASPSPIKPEVVDKNFFNALFGKDAIHQGCAVWVKKLREYSVEE
ncbi:MAG: hypothetical protein LBJ71_05310, partial [Holosporaceae bacterium]|nr:hypothetical protein [Holosporaceae bacterium]